MSRAMGCAVALAIVVVACPAKDKKHEDELGSGGSGVPPSGQASGGTAAPMEKDGSGGKPVVQGTGGMPMPAHGSATPWNVGDAICGLGSFVAATGDDQSFMDAIIDFVEADQCADSNRHKSDLILGRDGYNRPDNRADDCCCETRQAA